MRRYWQEWPSGARRSGRRAGISASIMIHAEFHLHDAADLELYGSLLWNLDALERLGILGGACRTDLALKHAEVTEFQAVAATQLIDDVIQKALNNALHHDTLLAGLIRKSVNQVLLGDRVHGKAPANVATRETIKLRASRQSATHNLLKHSQCARTYADVSEKRILEAAKRS